MKNVCWLFFSIFFINSNSYSQEYADAFVLEVFDGYVKVLSPVKESKVVSVVLLNKTLSKIYAKVATDKKDLKFISIEAQKTKSYTISGSEFKKLMFVPLSPTFQEIELVYGRKSYEIPEQK